MNLLFYAKVNKGNTRRVFEILRLLDEEVGIEFYRDFDPLGHRLRQPAKDLAAVVFFASGMNELDGLFSVRPYLEGIPLILVLPKSTGEYIRKGHLLRPRFLSFAEGGPREIGAVLNNMLQKAVAAPMQLEIEDPTGASRETGRHRRIRNEQVIE